MLPKSQNGTSCSPRNVCVKVLLTLAIGFGIACAVVATQSCRWYDLDPPEGDAGGSSISDAWDFLPSNKTTVASVGLFCHQPYSVDDNDNDNDNDTVDATATTTASDGRLVSLRGIRYSPPWVGTAHPWIFAAQLCAIVGPVLALCGWLEAVIRGRDSSGTVLALAVGVQTAGAVSGMALCDRSMACPWQLGALSNALAAGLLGAGCGLLSLFVDNDGVGPVRALPQEQEQEQEQQQDQPTPKNCEGVPEGSPCGPRTQDPDVEEGSFVASPVYGGSPPWSDPGYENHGYDHGHGNGDGHDHAPVEPSIAFTGGEPAVQTN